MLVSMFAPGGEFPLAFHSDAPSPSASGCALYVVFTSACPYSREAAQFEALSDEENRMPVTWLSMSADSSEAAFGELLRPDSRLILRSDTKRKLKIQAVPAAFLVDASNVVRSVWVYQGDERHGELRERCQ